MSLLVLLLGLELLRIGVPGVVEGFVRALRKRV